MTFNNNSIVLNNIVYYVKALPRGNYYLNSDIIYALDIFEF